MTLLDIIVDWLAEHEYELLYRESFHHNMYDKANPEYGWLHIGPLISIEPHPDVIRYMTSNGGQLTKVARVMIYVGSDFVSFIRPCNITLFAIDSEFFIKLKYHLDSTKC